MEPKLLFKHPGKLLAIDHTGTLVLLRSEDDKIYVRSCVNSDDDFPPLSQEELDPYFTYDAVFIPNSNNVVIYNETDLDVIVFDYKTGEPCMYLALEYQYLRNLICTPNGRYLIGNADEEHMRHGVYLVWDLTKAEVNDTLIVRPTHLHMPGNDYIDAVVNNSMLVLIDYTNKLLVWDFIQDKKVTEFIYPGTKLHLHGNFAAVYGDTGVVNIVNILNGSTVSTFLYKQKVRSAVLTGIYLITHVHQDGVYFWRRSDEKLLCYMKDNSNFMCFAGNHLFVDGGVWDCSWVKYSVFALSLAIGSDGDFGIARKLLGLFTL